MVEPYPSEKWWSESQLGWWNSQSMESHKIHVPKHQPEIIVAKWYPKIGNTMEIPQNLAMLENDLNPGVWGGVTLMTCFGMNGGLQPQMWTALNWWNKAYRSKFKVYQTISNIQMVKRQWGIVYGFPKAHGCPNCPTDPKASKLAVGTWLVRPAASMPKLVTWTWTKPSKFGGPCWLLTSETRHLSVAKYWKCWWVSPRLHGRRTPVETRSKRSTKRS